MSTRNLFTVAGVSELRRAFAELPEKLAKKVIRQSIRKGLKPIQAEAQRLAPVREGLLKKRIKIRAFTKRKRGIIGLEIRVGQGDFLGKTFYAAMVEFGTSKMPARPYMRPAFDTKGNEALALVMALIRYGIEREARALAGRKAA